jgi:hypothetical protein
MRFLGPSQRGGPAGVQYPPAVNTSSAPFVFLKDRTVLFAPGGGGWSSARLICCVNGYARFLV